MSDDPLPLRLSLELRPDEAGLTGSLSDDRGREQSFTGWLGLLTLLEAWTRPSSTSPSSR